MCVLVCWFLTILSYFFRILSWRSKECVTVQEFCSQQTHHARMSKLSLSHWKPKKEKSVCETHHFSWGKQCSPKMSKLIRDKQASPHQEGSTNKAMFYFQRSELWTVTIIPLNIIHSNKESKRAENTRG